MGQQLTIEKADPRGVPGYVVRRRGATWQESGDTLSVAKSLDELLGLVRDWATDDGKF